MNSFAAHYYRMNKLMAPPICATFLEWQTKYQHCGINVSMSAYHYVFYKN